MVNLFDNTFNKKVVAKLADENLKYTRAQYRDKLQLDLKNEHPPMVLGERVEGTHRGCKGELSKKTRKTITVWKSKVEHISYF